MLRFFFQQGSSRLVAECLILWALLREANLVIVQSAEFGLSNAVSAAALLKPSGPSLKLLNLMERKGLDAVI